jgi:hypothetical protein
LEKAQNQQIFKAPLLPDFTFPVGREDKAELAKSLATFNDQAQKVQKRSSDGLTIAEQYTPITLDMSIFVAITV